MMTKGVSSIMGKGFLGKNRMNLQGAKYFLLVILFILIAGWPSSGQTSNLIQQVSNGRIDWTNRIIEAVGRSTYPANANDKAQARSIAMSQAVRVARENLITIIKNIPLESKILVSDFLDSHHSRLTSLVSYIKRTGQVDILFEDKGEVKATLSLKFNGPLADLFLPEHIKVIKQIKRSASCPKEPKKTYTGIIIDCSGIGFKPCVIPKIVNERKEEIFGPAYVSRECVVKQGMVKYVVPPDSRIKKLWGGPNPLVLKALRVIKGTPTIVVLTNSDAELIRDEPRNLELFHHCRVVFLIK